MEGNKINSKELVTFRNEIQKFSKSIFKDLSKSSISDLIYTLDLYIDAKEESEEAEKLSKHFKNKPKLRDRFIIENFENLLRIEREINLMLHDYPNFDGIDFCDTGAKVFYIRGFHRDIWTHSYGNLIAVEMDFSNIEQCIEEFVTMWAIKDQEKYVKQYKNFIEEGVKNGWD